MSQAVSSSLDIENIFKLFLNGGKAVSSSLELKKNQRLTDDLSKLTRTNHPVKGAESQ